MWNKIELVKDETQEEKPYVHLFCRDINVHDLAILKEALEFACIDLDVTQTDENEYLIGFSLDSSDSQKRKKRYRNAGRYRDDKAWLRHPACTVGELKAKRKTMKDSEIIAELGCSKSTFYRIIKNMNDECVDFDKDEYLDDLSVWQYASNSQRRRKE